MSKIDVLNQNLSKNWIFGKIDQFLTVFGHKITDFEFSHRVENVSFQGALYNSETKFPKKFDPEERKMIDADVIDEEARLLAEEWEEELEKELSGLAFDPDFAELYADVIVRGYEKSKDDDDDDDDGYLN